MRKLFCQCQYCGYTWVITDYGYMKAERSCSKCNDSNVKIIEVKDKNPFGYEETEE